MTKSDSLIRNSLYNSTLVEELNDAEVETLARIMEVREYRAGSLVTWLNDDSDVEELRGDSLIMLGSGEVEITCNIGGATATLNLHRPGDLIAVVGFIFTTDVLAKTDTVLLVLERARFEDLLNSQPSIVYYVMRGIVRHVHDVVRRFNLQAMELASHL